MVTELMEQIVAIGVNDMTIDLFENQYPVPNGVTYNSYLILDEKTCLLDTVDKRKADEWEDNLKQALDGRPLDYLVIHHLEPDHAGSIARVLEAYPNVTLIGNAKTFQMLPQFLPEAPANDQLIVKEGDIVSFGTHSLTFYLAPMVHWPEVMVSYENHAKILFSADAFGTFGVNLTQEQWGDEAGRYYFNIVGKYGGPVQALLKKAQLLDISMICPLHGPVLKDNLTPYITLYDRWSQYEPHESAVLIACASIHGNTWEAARKLASKLEDKGQKVTLIDLCRTHYSYAVELAFRYDRVVLCASTYDGGLFLPMQDFLHHLSAKTWQRRTVAFVENGSWAPGAAREMRKIIDTLKDMTVLEPVVTIKSSLKSENEEQMDQLVEQLC